MKAHDEIADAEHSVENGVPQHHAAKSTSRARKRRSGRAGAGEHHAHHGSVFINDDERGLHHDFGKWLEELAPFNPDPNHYITTDRRDNADAHLKRQIMGPRGRVRDHKGQLDFGPWRQIFYGEFDGTGTSGCW
jgi:thiamine phosphate synthase YjbQ (UPF0047 family)